MFSFWVCVLFLSFLSNIRIGQTRQTIAKRNLTRTSSLFYHTQRVVAQTNKQTTEGKGENMPPNRSRQGTTCDDDSPSPLASNKTETECFRPPRTQHSETARVASFCADNVLVRSGPVRFNPIGSGSGIVVVVSAVRRIVWFRRDVACGRGCWSPCGSR